MQILNQAAFDALPGAVIFDTDNTLYAYDDAHEAAIAATRAKAVRLLGISESDFDTAYIVARKDVKQRLEGTASSHSRLLYFQRLLEVIGLRSQVLMALDFEQTYWRVFMTTSTLFAGTREFLDDLRVASIPTAVVTDLTAQIQFRKIVYFDLDHHFDHIVTSEEAGFDKPNAAPFELAASKIGPVSGPLWMIGDNPVCDIKGARDAIGAVTLQKKHSGVSVGKGDTAPDLIFEDYRGLSGLLRRLLDGRVANDGR